MNKLITCDEYEKLGTYFVYHNVAQRYNLTFERFVAIVKNNAWQAIVEAGQ